MKRGRAARGATIGAAALGTIVLPAGLSEAQSNQTEVRFLHAVAGAGPAALVVERGQARLPSAFAKPSGYRIYHPGATRLSLVLDGQSKPVATEKVRLGPGKYTVVAIGGKSGVDLLVYKDDGVKSGKATLRAIHAAAEVGRADVRLDGKVVVTGVGLGDATGYLPIPPGRHSVAVTRPGGKGGALVKANIRAVPGTASSAFVVGSAGMPAQVVLTDDGSAGPQAAPASGLGGATTDGSWLVILGSSLLGGTIGGASYFLSRRVRTRGAMVVSPDGETVELPTSFVAAGPPVAPRKKEEEAETGVLVGAMAAAANGNGHSNGNGNGGSAGPTLWTPPPGERWLSDPPPMREPTPVLANGANGEIAAAPKLPRFIIPDDEVRTRTPRFTRPEPAEVEEAPPADEATAAVEIPETAPDLTPVEAAVPPVTTEPEAVPEASEEPMSTVPGPAFTPQTEEILSAGPTPRFGVTEAATPRPTPFWERSDQSTEPLQPAIAAEPEAETPEVSEAPAEAEIPATVEAEPEPETLEFAEIVEPAPAASSPAPEISEEPAPGTPRLRALRPVTPPIEAPAPEPVIHWAPEPVVEVAPEPAAEAAPEPVIEAAPAPEPELISEPEAAPFLHAVPDVGPEPSSTSTTGSAVSTWSSMPAKRPGSHSTAHDVAGKVNFLVVSGAALVVTGLVVARRGGRH